MPRTMLVMTGALAVLVGALPALAQQGPEPPAPSAPQEGEAPPLPTVSRISFEEAVKRSLERNPTAAVAEQEVLRAEAIAKQVRAAWLPTLSANGTYTRLDGDRELSGRIILGANQLSANVQLTVPLIAPRQWVAYARSKENIGVARASGTDVRREVALLAARTYLTVIAQHRVLTSAERALETAKAHEEYAATRLQGGVGNRLDAVRASQERATAEARVKNQLASLVRAQEALGIVVGEDGALDAAVEPAFGAPPSIESALGEAASKRADIAAHRDRLEVARKTARDSWVDYLPALSAIAQPFYQDPPTLTQPRTGWQAQLVLQLPIFDGGVRYGTAEEREAVEAQARTRLEGALRQARSEVRLAFESVRHADEALASARDASKLAREALELAQLAYKAGATSNIEVVDAERRAHEAETAAAIAEDASRQARLDLLASCGRFP